MDYLEDVERVACADIPRPFTAPLQEAYMLGRNIIDLVEKRLN
jgi:hypothetical protein